MKKIILFVVFIIFYNYSFSQRGYAGIIYDNKASLANFRPYIFSRISENNLGSMDYYPVIGAGMNSLGNISASLGFDLTRPINKNQTINGIVGFSVELLGWDEVQQDYMPSFRLGIETNKIMILCITNQRFKTFLIDGVKGYDPSLKPTIGLFYKINRK